MSEIYYLGGSPCCGKSTIAEAFVFKYQLKYFKADDHLEEYIKKGAEEGNPLFIKINSMTVDETWLRDPAKMMEEFAIYDIMQKYLLEDLKLLSREGSVIAEGAAFTPSFMRRLGIDKKHYLCMVPDRRFQLEAYSKRPWVREYLAQCGEKEKAFENWMQRDCLYAEKVLVQAKEFGYNMLVVDGTKTIEENTAYAERLFFGSTV